MQFPTIEYYDDETTVGFAPGFACCFSGCQHGNIDIDKESRCVDCKDLLHCGVRECSVFLKQTKKQEEANEKLLI